MCIEKSCSVCLTKVRFTTTTATAVCLLLVDSFSIASHCKQSSTTIDSYIPKINIAPPQHLVTKLDECTQCDIENTVSVSGQTILQRLVTNTTFPVMHSFKTVVGSEEGLGITLEQV